jgi:hypothetical protein
MAQHTHACTDHTCLSMTAACYGKNLAYIPHNVSPPPPPRGLHTFLTIPANPWPQTQNLDPRRSSVVSGPLDTSCAVPLAEWSQLAV